MKQKIIFIGNSIVNGYPFSRGKSFTGKIRAAFKNNEVVAGAKATEATATDAKAIPAAGKKRILAADVINKGENGQTTADIMLRFERDVLDHQPGSVFIMTGTNDFIFREAAPKEAFDNLEKMAALSENAGIVPIYMTPILVDKELASEMWMAGMGIDYDAVNNQIEEFSQLIRESGKLYVDTCIAYQRYSEEASVRTYYDGVHPIEEGHTYLAGFIIDWILEHQAELGL